MNNVAAGRLILSLHPLVSGLESFEQSTTARLKWDCTKLSHAPNSHTSRHRQVRSHMLPAADITNKCACPNFDVRCSALLATFGAAGPSS